MIKVGIVGATGYTGAELIRILLTHPEVKITSLTAKIEESQPVQEIFPQFRGFIDMECKKFETIGEITKNVELVFLALPHTVSLEVVPEFLDSGIKVIDLSADYRFDSGEIYEEWYGVKHPYPALLREKVYGLAELYRDKIKKSHFVANPGCYPTSVILGLYPIVKMGLVEEVIVDSLSGISGAGRKADLSFIFPEVEGNLKAYKIATHRHQPEMEEKLSQIAGAKIRVTFVPHLVPISRGILTTMYVRVKDPLEKHTIWERYKKTYENEPFIQLLSEDESPQAKTVRGTNYCQIGISLRGNLVIIVTAIDNLVKGASGQAVQNMNIMYGWEETTSLNISPVLP